MRRPVPDHLLGFDPPEGRGEVGELSYASGRRLRWALVCWLVGLQHLGASSSFLTLTYGAEQPGDVRREADRAALGQALLRRGHAGLWVRELHRNGRVHLHAVVYGDVDGVWLRDWWIDRTGLCGSSMAARRRRAVHVAAVMDLGVSSYLVKLVNEGAKRAQKAGGDCGGRWWGRWGAETVYEVSAAGEAHLWRADAVLWADAQFREMGGVTNGWGVVPSVLVGDAAVWWQRALVSAALLQRREVTYADQGTRQDTDRRV